MTTTASPLSAPGLLARLLGLCLVLCCLLGSSLALAVTSTTSLALSSTTRTVGQVVTLTATMTGASTITGTVTFKDGSTIIGTAAVASKKAILDVSFGAVGTHSLTAVYGGDANNTTSTSSAKTMTVSKASPTNVLTAAPNPVGTGQSVVLTATLSGGLNPTGTVTFKQGSTTLGTGTVSNNVATLTTSFATTGTRSLTAVYAGDTNHNSKTSSTYSLVVNASLAATTTTLSATPNPATQGSSVTLTATVTGSSPTGTVTFKDGSTTLGTGTVSSGVATFSTSALSAGTHSLQASYGGNSTNATSQSSTLSLVVNASLATTTTTLSATPNPVTQGSSVTLTATIVGSSPTGTVTFKDGATTLGTGTISGGVATFSTSALTAGTHSLQASYGGNSTNATSQSSTVSLVVNASLATTTTTLSATPNPATQGSSVTLTATVTGSSPTGTVTFKDGSTTLGTGTVSGGVATFSTSALTAGTHSLQASYGGNSTNAASQSSALSLVVSAPKATTSTSISATPNPANVGQSVTISTTVTGNGPTGTVSFKDGGTLLGSATLAAGSASFSTSALALGGHNVTVDYPGDSNNAASVSTGLLVVVSAPVVTTGQSLYEYDPMGNLTRLTNPLGAPTEQSFDTLGRAYQARPAHPSAAGTQGTIGYAYDGQGQLKSVTDTRGLVTSYTTDGLGNTTALASPDTGSAALVYDEAGNLKQKTDARGVVTAYQYDALNRLLTTTYTKTGVTDETVTLTYDQGTNGKGRLTTMTDASGQTTWGYDAQGHVTSRVQSTTTAPALSRSVGYGYDTAGRLQTMTYPSGRMLTYSYNTAGQLSEIQLDGVTLLTSMGYAPFGPVQSWVWGNAQTYARTFDPNGRMTSFTLGDKTRSLTWDAASRLTNLQDQASGASTQTPVANATYDKLDRLTTHVTSTSNYGYGYDSNGNRTNLTVGGNSYTFNNAATSNWLNTTTGPAPARTYGYDAAGNPTADTVRSNYTWSNSGRLKSLTASGTTTAYAYNGFAQRTNKGGASPVVFAYDEAGHLVGEYDSAGNVIAEHIWLGDTPIAMVAGSAAPTGMSAGNPYYVFADQIDTPRALADKDGKVVWRWEGEGFGMTAPNEDPDSDAKKVTYNLRFPGQVYDKESGLHYNHFRYYDPSVGRYIRSDLIGLAGGLNTYAYVGGNPLSDIDPLGLRFCRPIKYGPLTINECVNDLPPPGASLNSQNSSTGSGTSAGTKAPSTVKEFCPECKATMPRIQAELQAYAWAGMAPGQGIPTTWNNFNPPGGPAFKKGPVWADFQKKYYPPNFGGSSGTGSVEEHPFGHPDIPGGENHDCPHFVAWNSAGIKKEFPYAPGS